MVWVDASGWDDLGALVRAESDLPAVGRGIVPGLDDAVVVWADQGKVCRKRLSQNADLEEPLPVAADRLPNHFPTDALQRKRAGAATG